MKAIYLKFPDEKTATEAVAPYVDRDPEGYSVDVIGNIEDVAGWHVNMLTPDDFSEFKQYEIVPNNPRRVFGGWQ